MSRTSSIEKRNKVIVAELAQSYLLCKLYIERSEYDDVDEKTLIIKKRIRYYIENIIFNILNERDRFIIQNEVLLNKKGQWYQGYLSIATYYRHRKKAYANFLSCLDI